MCLVLCLVEFLDTIHQKPNTFIKAASQVILKLVEAAFLFGS